MNRTLKRLMLLVAALSLFASCSDDDDKITPSITLSQRSLILSQMGEQATITYTGSNIRDMAFTTIPDGWQVSINVLERTISLVAPSDKYYFDLSSVASDITISVTSIDDSKATARLKVGTTRNVVDLRPVQSNSYLVSKAHTLYSFSAKRKGEQSEDSISPVSARIIWQTANAPLTMARLDGDNVVFYVPNDDDDVNGNGAISDVVEGNALIGAFDSEGKALWSWHVWVSNSKPMAEPVTLNGVNIMNCNLGAFTNANGSEEEILSSYGLYYQWGRKEPFPAPATFDAVNGYDALIYDEYGYKATISYVTSSASTGTMAYATAYPSTYITGVEASSFDWLYSAHSAELWGDEKSINDPCPAGWRVASPEVFEGLMLPTLDDESIAELASSSGWELSDGTTSELFMGLGRRGQVTGRIQNVNTNEERPAPWVGYYWSAASADGDNSSALYFAYDATNVDDCTIDSAKSSTRSTGMQIRCQKIE